MSSFSIDTPAARTTDPATSHAAAAEVSASGAARSCAVKRRASLTWWPA